MNFELFPVYAVATGLAPGPAIFRRFALKRRHLALYISTFQINHIAQW